MASFLKKLVRFLAYTVSSKKEASLSKRKNKKKKKKKHVKRRSELNGAKVDLDLIFCSAAKKYGIEKNLLKAMAVVESALNERAYRHEPMFWERYLKNNDAWKEKDPKIVSSSYGLMQLMFTTAWNLGFRGQAEDLYNPVINVQLGAKLLAQLIDRISATTNINLWPVDIALARYNGGSRGNPRVDGILRNQMYVDKVKVAYWEIKAKREKCE
jgi:soluble lytic murein transglycosylase-like protein